MLETFEFYIPNGHMSLNLEEFFPAGNARIRKMVRIMKQDPRNNVPGLIKDLKKKLLLYKKDLEDHKRRSTEFMFKWCSEKKKREDYIERKVSPTGSPLTSKKELAELNKSYKAAVRAEEEYRRDIRRAERTINGIEKNLELLNELEE